MSAQPEHAVHGAHPPHGPHAIDERTSTAGLRAVAVFEASKGLVVLILGIAILGLLHKDVEAIAERLFFRLHIDIEGRLAGRVLRAAAGLSDARVWAITGAAIAYAAVRFTEAWGLWYRRVWAEWFALLSGALYVPLETYKVIEHASWEHIGVLAINLAILGYMAFIRIRDCRERGTCEEADVVR